jgi:hypothetical protein
MGKARAAAAAPAGFACCAARQWRLRGQQWDKLFHVIFFNLQERHVCERSAGGGGGDATCILFSSLRLRILP